MPNLSQALSPAQQLRRAIASGQAEQLRTFLAQNPDWQGLTDGPFTAWSRVLVDKKAKRMAMLSILLEHGLDPNGPILFRGQRRLPLSVALQHARYPLVAQLLEAGAHARFGRHNKSALDTLVELFQKQPVDEKGNPVSSSSLGKLEHWLENMHAAGAPVTPAFAAFCCEKAQKPDSPYRTWLREGLGKGVLPKPYATVMGWHLQGACGLLMLALGSADDEPLGWLAKALEKVTPTGAWGMAVLTRSASELCSMERLEQVLGVVEGWWKAETGANNLRWPHDVLDGWAHGMTTSRVNGARNALFLRLLEWGLEHGLPDHTLLDNERPLARPFLGGSNAREQTVGMLEILASRGFSLTSPVGKAKAHQKPKTLEQFLEESNSGFWKNSKNADAVRLMFARRKAERLDFLLAQDATARPVSRGARL